MKKYMMLAASVIMLWCVVHPDAYAAVDIGLGQLGETRLPSTSVAGVIGNVLKFVTALIAALAVLMIVVSGVMYITAGGDSGKAGKAKEWLIAAITGLAIAIMAYSIVVMVGEALGAW